MATHTLKEQVATLTERVNNLEDVVSEVLLIIASDQPKIESNPIIEYDLPELISARLYWHYNGRPAPKGRTSYGMVLDNNNSKQRYHYNFEVMSHSNFAALADDDSLTLSERACINKTIDHGMSLQPTASQRVYMCGSKENLTPGKGYRLEPNFNTCAVIVVDHQDLSAPPFTWIFHGDKVLHFKPSDWHVTTSFSYKAIIYLSDFLHPIS